MSVVGGEAENMSSVRVFRLLTRIGLPGMFPQCPLLGENQKRDARRERASPVWSHWHGAEGKLHFWTSHILIAFAKSLSPHSYKGRLKSDWVWIARPLRSRHFCP
jgi:hypothetical protein